MTRTDTAATSHGGVRRITVATATFLAIAGAAGWYWHTAQTGAQEIAEARPPAAIKPISYPAPGKEPTARTEFPVGATPVSGPDITAALSNHTAVLPAEFVEYYAPDGKLHGMAEEKHYGGSWEVRNGTFCTLLQGSDASVCSPVERKDNTLYWSMDGEEEASPVSTMPGNPRGLN